MSAWDDRVVRTPPRLRMAEPAEGTLIPMADLSWARRERVDANIRRAIGDLRALAVEDTMFMSSYRAMADAFDACVQLLDTIEDVHSVRVGRVSL